MDGDTGVCHSCLGFMQGKAISLIHTHAQTVLQKATATLQAELGASAHAPPDVRPAAAAADGGGAAPAGARPTASSAVLCVRFRALAEPQLAPMLEELGKRSTQVEYRRLLSNIEVSFCSERASLVLPCVRQNISAIQKTEGLHEVARCACVCPVHRQRRSVRTSMHHAHSCD